MAGYQNSNIKKSTPGGNAMVVQLTDSTEPIAVELSGTTGALAVEFSGSSSPLVQDSGNNYLKTKDSTNNALLQSIKTMIEEVLEEREENNNVTQIHLQDPKTSNEVYVSEGNTLYVSNLELPTKNLTPKIVQQRRIFLDRLKDSNGSDSLNVNASSGFVDFEARPDQKKIRWIQKINLIFHSEQMNINNAESRRFGPLANLTNGLELTSLQNNQLINLFIDNVTVIGDFYQYADPGNIVSDVAAITTSVDFLLIPITLLTPISLFPGTSDYIRLRISDDLSGIDLFKVNLYMYEENFKD